VSQEDNLPTPRNDSGAEAAAQLVQYEQLKWSAVRWSLLVVVVAGAVLFRWLPHPVLALWAGGICGVLNALWTMRSGERLLERRSVAGFVLSSFVRIGLFGIVPVAFAVLGPWWSMAWYFAGFFLPLVTFALGAYRVSGTQ
jgi:hypothetical protein